MLQQVAIIRWLDGELVYYPPGGDEAQSLAQPAAREALAEDFAARRLTACFAVPGAELRLQQLAISPEERKHVASSLPYMLEEQLAEDVDQLHFASVFLDKLTLGVAVCSRERMAYWRELLAELPGVNLWLPEPLLLPWREGEWCIVIEGDQALLRSGPCDGFAIEADMLPVILEGEAAADEPPQAVVVYGADQESDRALVPTSLRDRLQWRRGNLPAAMLLAEAQDNVLNLCQGEYAPQLPVARWWRQWRLVAAVLAGVFCLQLLATYSEYRQLSRENIALRTAVQNSYRQASPNGNIVDEEKQLSRQLNALRGSGNSSGFVSLFAKVGAVIAAQAGTQIATINYNDKGNEMRLNIVAADYEAVEAIREAINRTGLEAVMESSSAQGDKVRARMRVGGRS